LAPEHEAAAAGPAAPAEDVIDLREYLRVLARRRGIVVLCALLAVATAGLLSFFVLPPVYEARTVLLVTQASEKVQAPVTGREGESVITTLTRLPALTMNTYVGQLKSETVAERTVKKLGLDPTLYTPVALARMATASVQKDSNLIELKVRHQDPVLAARIANTMAEELLALISEKNQEQMARSVQFLVDQRQTTEKELQKAVEELGKFDSDPRNVAFLEEQSKALTAELTRAQADLNAVTVEAEELRAGLARLEADLADTPRTVKVTRLDPATGRTFEGEDVNPVYVSLAEEVAKKKAGLSEKEARAAALLSLRAALTEELASLQGELTAKKARRDQLAAEVKRLEQTRDQLATKATETQIARSADLGSTTVVVVSPAVVPAKPVKPNKKLNVAVALVLGLMAGVALAFVAEHLDYTIRTPEDVRRHLGLPVLGSIPDAHLERRAHRAKAGGAEA
jgi:capsular polysaccharide biosynthesis protein